MKQPVDVIATFLVPPIQCLSNAEYQTRVWLKKLGPEEDSFAECVEMFYEAYDLIGQMEGDILIISQRKGLDDLYRMIKTFYKTLSDKDFTNIHRVLEDQHWHAIQAKAGEVLALLIKD
ncbi:MAG: hypothetical protein AB7H48_04150 [Parachlamydiales bacterium]